METFKEFQEENEEDVTKVVNELKLALPTSTYKDKEIVGLAKQASISKEQLAKTKNAVIILGNTGGGKSTFINYLLGADYKLSTEDLLKPSLKLADESKHLARTSAQLGCSTTSVPQLFACDNHVYIDYPGFNDLSDNKQSPLVGSLISRYISKHLKSTKMIVVLMNVDDLQQVRGSGFRDIVKTLRHYISDIDEVKDSLMFVFNKLEHTNANIEDQISLTDTTIDKLINGFTDSEGKEIKGLKKITEEDISASSEKLSELIKKYNACTNSLDKTRIIKKLSKLGSKKRNSEAELKLYDVVLKNKIYATFTDSKFRKKFKKTVSDKTTVIEKSAFHLSYLNVNPAEYDSYAYNYLAHQHGLLVHENILRRDFESAMREISETASQQENYETELQDLRSNSMSEDGRQEHYALMARNNAATQSRLLNEITQLKSQIAQAESTIRNYNTDERVFYGEAPISRKKKFFDPVKLWLEFDFSFSTNGVPFTDIQVEYKAKDGTRRNIAEAGGTYTVIKENKSAGKFAAEYSGAYFSKSIITLYVKIYTEKRNHPQNKIKIREARTKLAQYEARLANREESLTNARNEWEENDRRRTELNVSTQRKETTINRLSTIIEEKKEKLLRLHSTIHEIKINVAAQRQFVKQEQKNVQRILSVIEYIDFSDPTFADKFKKDYSEYLLTLATDPSWLTTNYAEESAQPAQTESGYHEQETEEICNYPSLKKLSHVPEDIENLALSNFQLERENSLKILNFFDDFECHDTFISKLMHILKVNRSIDTLILSGAKEIKDEQLSNLLTAIRVNGSLKQIDFHTKIQNNPIVVEIQRVVFANQMKIRPKIPFSFKDCNDNHFNDFVHQYHNQIEVRVDNFMLGNYQGTPLHVAAIYGRMDILEKMIERYINSDENSQVIINFTKTDSCGMTALQYAAAFGHDSVVANLLDLYATLEELNPAHSVFTREDLHAALRFAVRGDHLLSVKILLCHPLCDPSMLDSEGNTLYHVAAICNSVNAFKFLYECSGLRHLSVSAYNYQGESPIHLSVKKGKPCYHIAKTILQCGGDVDRSIASQPKKTPLFIAVEKEDIPLINCLVKDHFAKITPAVIDIANQSSNESVRSLVNNLKNGRQTEKTCRKTRKIKNIVMRGGGVKGIAFGGALLELEKSGMLENVQRVAGASAGAITAFLLAIGFQPQEFEERLRVLDFHELMDSDKHRKLVDTLMKLFSGDTSIDDFLKGNLTKLWVTKNIANDGMKLLSNAYLKYKRGRKFNAILNALSGAAHLHVAKKQALKQHDEIKKHINSFKALVKVIINDFGIFPGNKMVKWFSDWLEEKGINTEVTFCELHKHNQSNEGSNKDLYLVSTNMSKSTVEVFSHEHSPDVLVIDAVRAAMAFPIFFKPTQIRRKVIENGVKKIVTMPDIYADGGMIRNYPVNLFDYQRYIEQGDFDDTVDLNESVFNWQTLGFSLVSGKVESYQAGQWDLPSRQINNIYEYLHMLVKIYMDAEDIYHRSSNDYYRTIYIDNLGVNTLDFALNADKQNSLVLSGRISTIDYLSKIKVSSTHYYVSSELLKCLVNQEIVQVELKLTEQGDYKSHVKFNVHSPEQLFGLLRFMKSHEMAYIVRQPIDFSCINANRNTVVHLALSILEDQNQVASGEKVVHARKVLNHIIKLHETYKIGFNANCKNKQGDYPLDIIQRIRQKNTNDVDIQLLLRKLIKKLNIYKGKQLDRNCFKDKEWRRINERASSAELLGMSPGSLLRLFPRRRTTGDTTENHDNDAQEMRNNR